MTEISAPKPAPKLSAAACHALKHQELAAQATAIAAAEREKPAPEPAKPSRIRATPDPFAGPPKRKPTAAEIHLAKQAALAVAAKSGAAAGLTAPERPDGGPGASEYDLLKAQLGQHLDELSALKSVETKILRKRELVADYDTHVLSVLDAAERTGQATQDLVFVEIMIWRFDIGDWGMAFDMASHVLKFGLSLPERFKRTTATMILEEPAEAALKALTLKERFPVEVLQRAVSLTGGENINDKVCAKAHKAIGLLLARGLDNDEAVITAAGGKKALAHAALTALRRATQLFDQIGVKKETQSLERFLATAPDDA